MVPSELNNMLFEKISIPMTQSSSALKVTSFKDQDTLIEQSVILIEQSSLYSKPQVSVCSILSIIAQYNSLKIQSQSFKNPWRSCIIIFFTFKTTT